MTQHYRRFGQYQHFIILVTLWIFFVQYKPISVLEAKTRKNIQLYGPQRALWAPKCRF